MPFIENQSDFLNCDHVDWQLLDPILAATVLLAGGRTTLALYHLRSVEGQLAVCLPAVALFSRHYQASKRLDLTGEGFDPRRDLVRVAEIEGSDIVSFDVLFRTGLQCFDYRLWLTSLSARPWLIPVAGAGPFIGLSTAGLKRTRRAPFGDGAERKSGLELGEMVLRVAKQGWF